MDPKDMNVHFFLERNFKNTYNESPKNSWGDPHNLKHLTGVKKYTNGFGIFECNFQKCF